MKFSNTKFPAPLSSWYWGLWIQSVPTFCTKTCRIWFDLSTCPSRLVPCVKGQLKGSVRFHWRIGSRRFSGKQLRLHMHCCDLFTQFIDNVVVTVLILWHFSHLIKLFHNFFLQFEQVMAHNVTRNSSFTTFVVLAVLLIASCNFFNINWGSVQDKKVLLNARVHECSRRSTGANQQPCTLFDLYGQPLV